KSAVEDCGNTGSGRRGFPARVRNAAVGILQVVLLMRVRGMRIGMFIRFMLVVVIFREPRGVDGQAWNVEVIPFALHTIDMPGEIAGGKVYAADGGAQVG